MLFKQIYNWLKYKTTTPSTLFKNRLFIERDSKHKRIFNNVGLTFRNLKWNSYESENVQPTFKLQYFKIVFFTFFCLILFVFVNNFHSYYTLSYFYNNVFFFFWTGLDIFDYYFTFLIWTAALVTSLITNLFQSYFFFNNLNSNSKTFKVSKFNLISDYKKHPNIDFPKKDYKFFLLNWLNSKHSLQQPVLFTNLKTLFVTTFNDGWWQAHYVFFLKLYRLTYFLNLNNRLNSSHLLHLKLTQIESINSFNLLTYLATSNLLNRTPAISFFYLLRNQNNPFDFNFSNKLSMPFLDNKTFWNPMRVFNVNQDNLDLFKQINGFFYFNNTSSSELTNFIKKNKNLSVLDPLICNQIASAKWNRWLYKYSILHRKVFKNSHKVTLSKKMLNSGLYNSDLSKKNLWNSEFFNKSLNFNLLHFATSLLQSSNTSSFFFQNFSHSKSVYDLQHSQLATLNVHEMSFFWFLKRFYFFSSLENNRIFSTAVVKKTALSGEVQNLNNFFNFQNFLLKSSAGNFNILNLDNFHLNFIEMSETAHVLNKDSHLLFSDSDLFSKDNLEILNWLTIRSSLIQNTKAFVPFFYLNNFSKIDAFKINKFYCADKKKKIIGVTSLLNLINNSDNVYLRDLSYLLFFYQK